MTSPLEIMARICFLTLPVLPAQMPYSSRLVTAQVMHSRKTGQTSHRRAARLTSEMFMVFLDSRSSLPKK